jgi:hypothetical protein
VNLRRGCPICQRADARMTAEDVLPQWLRRHILAGLPDTDPNRFPRMKYSICETCNAALNVHFEHPARPILLSMMRGESMVLTAPNVHDVAGWMVKTDLLVATFRRSQGEQFFHPAGTPVDLSQSLRSFRGPLQSLLVDRILPKETTVCAGFVDEAPRARAKAFRSRTDGDVGLYSLTRWPPLVYETVIDDGLHDQQVAMRESDDRLVVLWPPRVRPVSWPPKPMTLDESETLMMSRDLGTWRRPIRPRR